MSEVKVSGLNVYPIKSCGAVELEEANVTPTGLEDDRRFMLVDAEGKFYSQRRQPNGPKLTLIRPYFKTYKGSLEGVRNGRLGVSIENFGEIDFSLFLPPHHGDDDVLPPYVKTNELDLVEADLHGNKAAGAVVSTEANEFFSTYLGEAVRLIRTVDAYPRNVSQNSRVDGASNRLGFADAYSILLASQRSLGALSQHPAIVNLYPDGLPMNRISPNIEIEGDGLEAYDEDFWRKIRIGRGLVAFVMKPCDIDQQIGEVGKGLGQALAVGQNLNHVYKQGIKIAVGDSVVVEECAEVPNTVIKMTSQKTERRN
jgi:uncharacterized protein YcbX